LTLSNGFGFGPAANARVEAIKDSWFFLKLLAATFEANIFCISKESLNYIFVYKGQSPEALNTKITSNINIK
jgi:hypothetical protein